jgi:hypothetical protein
MSPTRLQLYAFALLLALGTTTATPPAVAAPQGQPAGRAGARGAGDQRGIAVVITDDQDARQTRERLRELLERYPPALGRVLKLDPSLLASETYLAPYPALAAFLTQHPEVARDPAYFLAYISVPGSPSPSSERSEVINMWRNMVEGFTFFLVFLTITGTLAWLVKSLMDYRRWQRLSKIQTEAHTKLLDRFSSNEDLLTYIQTPAGRRFLESAPIPLNPETRSLGAPFSRILWSVQAGVVLTAGGIGLRWVSGRVPVEMTTPLSVFGVLGISLGLGFIISAVIAFVLSHRLGLFEPAAFAPTGDRGGPA